MKNSEIRLQDWIRAIDAGAAFRILLYLLLPTITLLREVTDPTGRHMFVMTVLFGVGIPVAVFGLWRELKSIAKRTSGIQDTVDD